VEGIRSLPATTFEAVVMVADEASLLESASWPSVTLAVVDLPLIRGDTIGLVRKRHARCPEMKMIVITAFDGQGVRQSAFEAGASGFVPKRPMATDLLPKLTCSALAIRSLCQRHARASEKRKRDSMRRA
jgi:DNA-binding NarL/FixJ family response regulator